MVRYAFTLIELIFVIVILGILAAIAIPKLVATRDDATVTTKIHQATRVVTDFGSYYTARASFGKVSDMTNIQLADTYNTENRNGGVVDMNASSDVWLTDGRGVSCIRYSTLLAGSQDGNITVTSLGGVSSICEEIETVMNDRNISSVTGRTYMFAGIKVKH